MDKYMQKTLNELRPDGAPWKMVQNWAGVEDSFDPLIEEQIWKHATTDELITNQRAKP